MRTMVIGWLAALILCGPSGDAMAETATLERLKTDVYTLAERIGSRSISSPGALRAAEAHVTAAFEKAGHRVKRLPFSVGAAAVANLEVVIPGASKETVVLGAHYDSVPGTPGADDNASGVAVLLEMARRLRPGVLRRTVRLVAFVNEEPPYFKTEHMGSLVYARYLRAQGVDVKAMIALDMLGYYDTRAGSQSYPPVIGAFFPDSADFVAIVGDVAQAAHVQQAKARFGAGSGLPVESISAPRFVTGVDFSDHWSFWQAGYPGIMITDTAFFRNPHYHEPGDRAGTLDYRRLAMAAEGVHAVLLGFAGP